MTECLKSVVGGTIPPDVSVDFVTAPSDNGGIPSINEHYFPHLQPLVDSDKYDGFLVACYSEHPLVEMLAREIQNRCKGKKGKEKKQYVIGILEASVIASLGLLLRFPSEENTKFGIVSTGSIWESALLKGVNAFLASSSPNIKFAGVETTGLSAIELHKFERVLYVCLERKRVQRCRLWVESSAACSC
ncbi:tubulin gamma chain [Moniliophthora roreri MCA 2997]|uniref:Tubulin gamma chain n=1 Tax=Moniliophthora roreri (strain MCA 2997) TaxID=1381753 RepID=V2WT44_MONRO|nr:tubulin gamma chain [Moniliophthora roreri MCA 2997]